MSTDHRLAASASVVGPPATMAVARTSALTMSSATTVTWRYPTSVASPRRQM
jgi:hypothetical protein